MVVNDVECYGHSLLMASVYQPLQSCGASVRVLHCIRVDAVIAPVSVSRKLCYRHKFDCGDPQILQLANSGNDRVECSLWRKCSDMKFIEDILFQGNAEPTVVSPCDVRSHYFGRTVHSLRLKSRSGVWPFPLTSQRI